MTPVAPLQAAGGGLAVLVTFLVATLFYAATLHLAAVFFLGEVPLRKSVLVGLAVAAVSLVARPWGTTVFIPAALVTDAAAIGLIYDRGVRATVALTLLHLAFATVLGFALRNLVTLL